MEYLNDLVRAWSDFRTQSYSDTLLVAVGALITLFAVIRLVKSSLSALLWVICSGIGLALVMQGSGRAPWESRSLAGAEIEELIERGDGVLQLLCDRLEEARGAFRASAEPPAPAEPGPSAGLALPPVIAAVSVGPGHRVVEEGLHCGVGRLVEVSRRPALGEHVAPGGQVVQP